MDEERVTQLSLTVMDVVDDPATFLQALRVFLESQGATANGLCRFNVNLEKGSAARYIKILNNQPVLSSKQEVQRV